MYSLKRGSINFLRTQARCASSITMENGRLFVPKDPIIPYIEGDGTGPDIWRAAQMVIDGAVEEAYGGRRKIHWLEVLAGEKAFRKTGNWLPDETVEAYKKHLVGIKGPLTTPIGGGIRSLNVALRQLLDLYVCLRPVRYFKGVPSPVKHPENVDMVIFRENTEDIYAGVEFEANSSQAKDFLAFLEDHDKGGKLRFPTTSAFGIKPVSREGTFRLVEAAIKYALQQERRSVTFIAKSNIMKYTEGAFVEWGYECAKQLFRDQIVTEREAAIIANYDAGIKDPIANVLLLEPGFNLYSEDHKQELFNEVKETIDQNWVTLGDGAWKTKLLIKNRPADISLQQVLTRPSDYDIIASMNLNGDYLSDALAAQVGGIGIAPGGNINYKTGHAIFEATHGTAPKYANKDVVNPGSVILSGEMMLRHLGWNTAARLIIESMDKVISNKTVTYDFERLMTDAKKVKCSQFGSLLVEHMELDRTW